MDERDSMLVATYTKRNHLIIGFFIIFIFCMSCEILAVIVGSKSVASSQAFVTFPASDTNNTLLGFASFDQGFALADQTTSATFDNYQMVNDLVNLNGGKLVLRQDCLLGARTIILSGGRIEGNGRALSLPEGQLSLQLPATNTVSFNALSSVALESVAAADVVTVDWALGDNYLVSGQQVITGPECKMYYFNGVTLTTTKTLEIGVTVNSLRWHPSQLFFAMGLRSGAGNNIRVYRYTVSNGSLTAVGGATLTGSINAVCWHPSGNYLVLGRDDNTQEIRVYPVTSGVLGVSYGVNLASNQDINRDALSFSPGGNQLAVGLTSNVTANISELMLYNFTAASLTLTSSLDTGANLQALDWSPTGSYIVAALTGSSNNIRVYDASKTPIRELLTSRQTESRNAYAVDWHPSGNYVAVSVSTGVTSQTLIYFFDKINQQLTYLTALPTVTQTLAHRWSRSGDYLAFGAQAAATTFSFNVSTFLSRDPQLFIDSTTLICNSDVVFAGDFQWKGTCRINGQGNKISFLSTADCVIRPNSTLTIENAVVTNLRAFQLRCMNNSSSIILRNCALVFDRDVTFSQGALSFQGEVVLSGTNAFNYTTPITSTITAGSTLFLDRGVSFVYNPSRARRDLLYSENSQSAFYLYGASLVTTRTGLTITQGKMILDDAVTFSSGALYFSEGLLLGQALDIQVLGGATLNVHGFVRYGQ